MIRKGTSVKCTELKNMNDTDQNHTKIFSFKLTFKYELKLKSIILKKVLKLMCVELRLTIALLLFLAALKLCGWQVSCLGWAL